MKLVKLDAINSTNTFLKLLAKDVGTSNWTVVTAEYQSGGRGQIATKWQSDRGKNLICSTLIKFNDFNVNNQFYLNCAVSIGIFNALSKLNIPDLKVKWPNDIMAGSKKIAGILIENSLNGSNIYQSVIGIGLNVNQKKFPKSLSNAISIGEILNKSLDRNILLENIVSSIKEQVKLLKENKFSILHENYEQILYENNEINSFEGKQKNIFSGIIRGVSEQGKLLIETENKNFKSYNFKEIKFL